MDMTTAKEHVRERSPFRTGDGAEPGARAQEGSTVRDPAGLFPPILVHVGLGTRELTTERPEKHSLQG